MLIRGTVTGPDGSAIEGAVVSCIEAPADVADIAAVTGDDGSFVVAAPVAGRYRFVVRAGGHQPAHVDADVVDQDVDSDVGVAVALAPDGD